MAKRLSFKILTPYLTLLSKTAEMITMPAEDGEIGVLPEHIALITRLEPGHIKVYNDSKVEDSIFIFGGFAKISQNSVTVLVNADSMIPDLDPAKASAEIPVFEDRLMTTINSEHREALFKEIMTRRKIVEAYNNFHSDTGRIFKPQVNPI